MWWEKSQTPAAVRTTINDYLFKQPPHPEFNQEEIGAKTDKVYEYLVERYAA
jgi:hypothetical protein